MKDIFILEVEEDDYWGTEFATIYRLEKDGSRTQIGGIGGEPEDNTYYRTYSWILDALNDAYKLGIRHGIKREYDRLADKI